MDRDRYRKIVVPGAVVPFDVDAQIAFDAVIANGGALSTLEKGGYNVYRIDQKGNANPWESENHLNYPMVGGTVESMVINFQDPGTFDAIAVNTVVGDFTANGWTPNGVDSYLRMGLIASTTLTIQSAGLEYYSRTNVAEQAIDIGAINDSNKRLILITRWSNDISFWDTYDQANGRLNVANLSSLDGFFGSRIASNNSKVFKSGVEYGSLGTSGGTQPTVEFYLGAVNTNGAASDFSTKQSAGAGIYDGLIPAKVLSQYTARQAYNTLLSRNV